MYNKLITIFFGASFLFSFQLKAQTGYNSPYTKFGFGSINSLESAFQLGQGGLSYTDAYYSQVNLANPASYTFIARHLPVFDVNLGSEFIDARSTDTSQWFKTSYLSSFTLGLPTGKKSGVAMSYQPFSRLGYNITDSLQTPDGFAQKNVYRGQGSINRLMLGYGRLLFTSDSSNFVLSGGFNASYLFGAMSNLRQSSFEPGSGYTSFIEKDSSSIKDVMFEGGLHAKYIANKNTQFSFGLTYSHTTNLNATNEYVAYKYFGSVLAVIDTLGSTGIQKGSYTLPGAIGAAVSVNYKHKYGAGIQFTHRNMSNFASDFRLISVAQFTASNQINMGFWYKPSASADYIAANSFKNGIYKIGFRYQTLGLLINNTEITEMAVSTGVNIPLVSSGSLSSINFGIEFGLRGTTDQGLVQERFAQLKFGVAITPSKGDRWFVKRKYD